MIGTQEKRTKTAFVSSIAEVSLSHLLELMMVLGSYRDGLVLVGGWVPYLLLKEYQNPDVSFQHLGSWDIDLAVNQAIVDEKKYATILELLQARGYRAKEGTTFSFVKTVTTNKGENQIQIDFLGPEYGGTPKNKRHQTVQDDFLLRKARGADVVLDHAITISLEGKLSNGAEGKVKIKIADIVGILTMKGIALGSRYKEKDAYDINSLVLYYKSGPRAVAEEIRPYKEHGLVKEALELIRDKFRSQEAEGPNLVADFQEAVGEAREQIKTQTYLQIQRFLRTLDILPPQSSSSVISVPDDIPVLDVLPGLGGSGGPSGHFVQFHAINTGDKVAIDCRWGIRGFVYEWRSPEVFMLRPGNEKKLEYKISDEKPFHQFVPELNIFFEYKTNRGLSLFTRRELLLEKVPSGAFYTIQRVSTFHPAVVLTDSKIRKIGKPFMNGDREETIVEVEVDGRIKKIHIGISRTLVSIFGFSTSEEVKGAFGELIMRKVAKMLREESLQDYVFTSRDLPNKRLAGFEAYQQLRDFLDKYENNLSLG